MGEPEQARYGTRHTKAGPPRKSTRKAQEREDDIYRVAAQIFHRKGYAATSLQDIADEVGVLKGSLYYYIDSKEDLLYGITKAIHALAQTNLDNTARLGGTATERMAELVRGHVSGFAQNMPMIRVFYTDYSALSPDRRAAVMQERRAYEQFTRALIEEGQATGEFCRELDARTVCNAILTMVNTVYMWHHGRESLTIDDVANVYSTFAVRGLQCPPGHSHVPAAPARKAVAKKASGVRASAKKSTPVEPALEQPPVRAGRPRAVAATSTGAAGRGKGAPKRRS